MGGGNIGESIWKNGEPDIGLLVVEPISNWENRDKTKVDEIKLPVIPPRLV